VNALDVRGPSCREAGSFGIPARYPVGVHLNRTQSSRARIGSCGSVRLTSASRRQRASTRSFEDHSYQGEPTSEVKCVRGKCVVYVAFREGDPHRSGDNQTWEPGASRRTERADNSPITFSRRPAGCRTRTRSGTCDVQVRELGPSRYAITLRMGHEDHTAGPRGASRRESIPLPPDEISQAVRRWPAGGGQPRRRGATPPPPGCSSPQRAPAG
jgi:hypothetical protein